VDSGGSKEACIRWSAHWRNLANTIEQSMRGGDVVFLSDYFDHLLLWTGMSIVGRSDTLVSATKTAEPIQMPFGLRTGAEGITH